MKIVAITDLHDYLDSLERLRPVIAAADLLLVAGDVTNFGGADHAERAVERLTAALTPVLLVPGNCDRPEAARVFDQSGLNVDGRFAVIGDVTIAGVGGSLPCPAPTCVEYSDAVLGEHLAAATRHCLDHRPLVLLVHQPPYGVAADWAHNGRHVGSRMVRAFIERVQPLVVVCGHIHEGRCIDRIEATTVVNPGPLRRGRYAWIEIVDGELRTAELRDR